MKKTTIFILLACITLTVSAGPFKNALKKLGKAVASVAVGVADSYVQSNLSQEDRDNWNKSGITQSVVQQFNLNNTYVSAGSNFYEGKTSTAVIDVTEGVLTDAGVNNPKISKIIDIARIQNQYKLDINSGVDPSIAHDKWANNMGNNLVDFVYIIKEERDQMRREKMQAIHDAIKNRGYNENETMMYYDLVSEDALNDDVLNPAVINSILDNYNIVQKNTSSSDNDFFGVQSEIKNEVEDTILVDITPAPAEDPYETELKEISNTAISQYCYLGYKLTNEQKIELDKIASFMNRWSDAKVTIVGHICSIGKHDDNIRLGMRRAHQAKLYLVSQGIDESRISEDSMADELPCANNDTEEGRLLNRRITFVIN
jgi:outer membrane protein OmpA-like peptidoglycan-associated protein